MPQRRENWLSNFHHCVRRRRMHTNLAFHGWSVHHRQRNRDFFWCFLVEIDFPRGCYKREVDGILLYAIGKLFNPIRSFVCNVQCSLESSLLWFTKAWQKCVVHLHLWILFLTSYNFMFINTSPFIFCIHSCYLHSFYYN